MLKTTDYGHPMKPVFIEITNFWAWADNLGRYILGHWGYFWPIYQHPFCYIQKCFWDWDLNWDRKELGI